MLSSGILGFSKIRIFLCLNGDLSFSPTALANGVFSPDKPRCVPVRVAGAGSGKFPKVPEGSGAGPGAGCKRFRCRLQAQVPEGSRRFRRVLESSASFRKVLGGCRRFWKVLVQGQVQVASAGSERFRKVPVQV